MSKTHESVYFTEEETNIKQDAKMPQFIRMLN